jgi:hypothetical protein
MTVKISCNNKDIKEMLMHTQHPVYTKILYTHTQLEGGGDQNIVSKCLFLISQCLPKPCREGERRDRCFFFFLKGILRNKDVTTGKGVEEE